MAKRRTPRSARPTRARGTTTTRRAAPGRSTRKSATRRTTIAARARRAATPATGTSRSSGATRQTSPKGKHQKRAPAAAKKRRASAGRPDVGALAKTLRQPTGKRPAVRRSSAPKSAPPRQQLGKRGAGSLREQVERDRRLMEETVRTPPSSLNLDRHPSAARSGRAELEEALAEHTEAGPALTGGDVDADWESAYATGDEAPGGDMPTPDQAVVEDIGSALGVQYQDDEELKGAEKIEARDRHRWELDPASSEDYRERAKPDRRRR